MKIESNPKMVDTATPHSKKLEKNKSAQTFGQILSEQTKAKTSSPHQISAPPPLAGLQRVNLMPLDRIETKSAVIKKVEELLDVLDQYRVKLGNPNSSLREIEPLTRDMINRATELTPELDKLDPNDSLSSILNETLVTVSLETKKFENGWYNP